MKPNRNPHQYKSLWENETLVRQAVAEGRSTREAIQNLGVPYSNSAVKTFRKVCAKFGIDLSNAFPDRYSYHLKIPDDEVFVIDSPYVNNRIAVKQRALNNGWLTNECSICGLGPEWQGQPLVLQMDHINGHNNDHRIENLRILCPDCHTQTWSYAGRTRPVITVECIELDAP